MSSVAPSDKELLKVDKAELWLQTFSGIQFYPYRPEPSMVRIKDIAHALSMKCRFGGHIGNFYSVAEHSVYVSQLVPDAFKLEALLHDAAEAYIGDMVMPVKRGQPEFCDLESLIWTQAIAPKYVLPGEMSEEVRIADLKMLCLEKQNIVRNYGHEWDTFNIEIPKGEIIIQELAPQAAERLFLETFMKYI